MPNLYVITGPAGVGKSTVSKKLAQNLSKSALIEGDEIVESISYKSLLSLMYYELFLDIKNGNIPNYCFDCQKFYLPDSKHKCKK